MCNLLACKHAKDISHLGLESQMQICESYIKETDGQLVRVFQDVQSGKSKDRKGLLDAIEFCKKNKCELVFAKLDRLARDVEFTFKVVNTGIQVHFCDMPQLNTLILGVMATVAQYERHGTARESEEQPHEQDNMGRVEPVHRRRQAYAVYARIRARLPDVERHGRNDVHGVAVQRFTGKECVSQSKENLLK